MFVITSMSDLGASAGVLSGPAASPFLIYLMDMLIISIIGGITSPISSVECIDVQGVQSGLLLLPVRFFVVW
ncbi:unnamed protein product [Schistosoma mattheei]|uniref:Uncharacterized protein n=1 Tax=Schistosoma mattheei TaxID=31246 RepID=A0A183NDG8_9TREM|nr:unnamed protein product [Schistosoma mattheei]